MSTQPDLAAFYRDTLTGLDKARVQLTKTGAAGHVIAALDAYRRALQSALHTPGVAR